MHHLCRFHEGAKNRSGRSGPNGRTASPQVFVRPWCAVHGNYSELSALEQHQIAELGMAKLDCLFEHGLKYGPKLTGRARNDLKHIRRRRLLLQGLA